MQSPWKGQKCRYELQPSVDTSHSASKINSVPVSIKRQMTAGPHHMCARSDKLRHSKDENKSKVSVELMLHYSRWFLYWTRNHNNNWSGSSIQCSVTPSPIRNLIIGLQNCFQTWSWFGACWFQSYLSHLDLSLGSLNYSHALFAQAVHCPTHIHYLTTLEPYNMQGTICTPSIKPMQR